MSEEKKLEALFNNGKITRREFMVRLSVMGMAAASLPGMLPKAALAAAPKKGGRFILGSPNGSTTDVLDPALISSHHPLAVCWQTMNNLVEIDADSKAIPELAESWDASADARKWYFKLRRGVEFHNGKPFEAADVLFSLQRHLGEDSKSAAKGLIESITNMKADGKHEVVFELKDANADFPYILSDYHLQIMPAGTTDPQAAIGTGGYTLMEWEPGVRSLVKRNPNYWKAGRAHFDEVETLVINDGSARTNALKTGQVHFISDCDPKTFNLLEKVPGINGVKTTGMKHYCLTMRTDTAPFDKNDVRLALKFAIDREQLLNNILQGFGVIGNDHPISPAYRFYNGNLAQRVYDPDKARFHIKKAGLENHTFKLHTSVAAFEGAVDMVTLYKEQAAKAGITIDVVREPVDGYWSNVWMKKGWCTSYWGGRPTEDMMFSTAYAAGASWNESYWQNERFNTLLMRARGELDTSKRRTMYEEMQQILRDDGGTVIPLFITDLMAASDKLAHGKVASNIDTDGARIGERWWFA